LELDGILERANNEVHRLCLLGELADIGAGESMMIRESPERHSGAELLELGPEQPWFADRRNRQHMASGEVPTGVLPRPPDLAQGVGNEMHHRPWNRGRVPCRPLAHLLSR